MAMGRRKLLLVFVIATACVKPADSDNGATCSNADVVDVTPSDTEISAAAPWKWAGSNPYGGYKSTRPPTTHCCKNGNIKTWQVAIAEQMKWVGSFSAICSDGQQLPAVVAGENGEVPCHVDLLDQQEIENDGIYKYQIGFDIEGLMIKNPYSNGNVSSFTCPAGTVAIGFSARSQCMALGDARVLCGKKREASQIPAPNSRFSLLDLLMVLMGTAAATCAIVIILLIFVCSCSRRNRLNSPSKENNLDYIEKGMKGDGLSLQPLTQDTSCTEILLGPAPPVTEMPFFQGLELIDCPEMMHVPIQSQTPYSFDSLPERFKDCSIAPSDLSLFTPSGRPIVLGEGGCGKVLKATYLGSSVAVKILKSESPEQAVQFLHEISILEGCRHRHIVSFYGWSLHENSLVLVMEYLNNQNLYERINDMRDPNMHWYKRGRDIMHNVASGLNFLHNRVKSAHMNLKSSNVLLRKDGEACIADVELGKLITDAIKPHVSVPTSESSPWRAPERADGLCGFPSDIYAFGVMCWEVCKLQKPNERQLKPLECPKDCPENVKQVIDKCLLEDPEQRPAAAELCEWFKAV